jgi:hypothetical protein
MFGQDKIKYASFDPNVGLNIMEPDHFENEFKDTRRQYGHSALTENQEYLENPEIN